MAKYTVLLADDEEGILTVYKKKLEAEDLTVLTATNGHAALSAFYEHQNEIDLVVLDWMMPGVNGKNVCEEIKRNNKKVPVVMLTARNSEDDQLEGIEMGADDYICKDESPRLIVGKIKRQLGKIERENGRVLEVGAVRMDLDLHQMYLSGQPVRLSQKEWDLLRYLVEHKDTPLSREQLIKSVWNYSYFDDTRTLDTHIKKLRRALGDCQDYIQTIWSFGYKFSETLPPEGRVIYDASLLPEKKRRH